jgi:hypothetical protein
MTDENGINSAARPAAERWRIAKDIPIAVVGAVILQTLFLVVWITNLSGTVNAVVANQLDFKNQQYTRDDARRDRELIDQKMITRDTIAAEQMRHIGQLEGRIQRCESVYKR